MPEFRRQILKMGACCTKSKKKETKEPRNGVINGAPFDSQASVEEK
jgi:hypothetical protein